MRTTIPARPSRNAGARSRRRGEKAIVDRLAVLRLDLPEAGIVAGDRCPRGATELVLDRSQQVESAERLSLPQAFEEP